MALNAFRYAVGEIVSGCQIFVVRWSRTPFDVSFSW